MNASIHEHVRKRYGKWQFSVDKYISIVDPEGHIHETPARDRETTAGLASMEYFRYPDGTEFIMVTGSVQDDRMYIWRSVGGYGCITYYRTHSRQEHHTDYAEMTLFFEYMMKDFIRPKLPSLEEMQRRGHQLKTKRVFQELRLLPSIGIEYHEAKKQWDQRLLLY